MPRFLTTAADKALREAIASIEAASSAELAITVRDRAHRIAAPAIVIGLGMAVAMLAIAAFSTTPFARWQLVVLPLVVGAIGAAIAHTGPIERVLVPPRARHADIRGAARAAFYARKIHTTTGRTGILVFVALHERMVELVGDIGAVAAIGQHQLDAWGAHLATTLAGGAEATAAALAKLAPEFAAKLPHQAGDANELADAVEREAAET